MSSFLSSLFGSSKPLALPDPDSPPSPGYVPAPGHAACTFGAGCFWSPQLAFDRQPGVVKTEVGYSQGVDGGRGARDSCAQRSILLSLQQPCANSVEMERRSKRGAQRGALLRSTLLAPRRALHATVSVLRSALLTVSDAALLSSRPRGEPVVRGRLYGTHRTRGSRACGGTRKYSQSRCVGGY